MAKDRRKSFKAWVLYDERSRPVPSTLVLRSKKPAPGDWREAFNPYGTCCVYTTTTSTSTSTTSTTTAASYQTLTGYFNSASSNKFCTPADSNIAFTVYTATQTTLAAAYANSASIYSDTGLTITANIGFYGNSDGGSGIIWYRWGGSSFVSTGTCP